MAYETQRERLAILEGVLSKGGCFVGLIVPLWFLKEVYSIIVASITRRVGHAFSVDAVRRIRVCSTRGNLVASVRRKEWSTLVGNFAAFAADLAS